MEKSIKVKEDTYKKLNSLAGELQMREKKPVSVNDALNRLLSYKEKTKVSAFAGSWAMSEEESEEIKKDLKKVWKTWKVG